MDLSGQVNINQSVKEGQPRKIYIAGAQDAVERASSMIHEVLAYNNVGGGPASPPSKSGTPLTVDVPIANSGGVGTAAGSTTSAIKKNGNKTYKATATLQQDQQPPSSPLAPVPTDAASATISSPFAPSSSPLQVRRSPTSLLPVFRFTSSL